MTLNLTLVSPRNVYQCSDFRLAYRDGVITDHEAQKIIVVNTFNWSALVQFSGVAKNDRNFDTSHWLATLDSQIDPRAPLRSLKQRLLEAGTQIGLSTNHTFTAAGFNEERHPFVLVVSNCQLIDDIKVSPISGRPKWRATWSRARHGAFATGSGASLVNNSDLRMLRKAVPRLPKATMHRTVAELNRKAWERAGANGSVSESCFTGQISADGQGTLVPHNVNPGGEYLPKFALNFMEGNGARLRAKTDAEGNRLPMRLVQIVFGRRATPGMTVFACEFSNVKKVEETSPQ